MSKVATPSAFAYVAVRTGGGRKFGIRQASNLPALAQDLRGENQLLMKSWKLPGWMAREGTLGLREQATLNEQLAQLLGRGVPLVEAMDVVVATVKPAARPRLKKMRDLVSAGSSFADACRAVGGFDNVTIAVYRGAERTGELCGAAKELSATLRRRLAVSGKATTLMVYPAIVLGISVIVATMMLTYIVPRLGEAMTSGGVELPWFSRVVMGLGMWMRDNLIWLLIGVVIAVTAAVFLRGALLNLVNAVARRMPMLKDVLLAQESARFFSVMAAMTRTGVPLGDALGVANQAVSHPKLRGQLERLRNRLIEGGLLRTLIEEVVALPVATRRLLIAAERSGDLESAFATLANDMTDEVDRKSQRALAALEPALIVFMFAVIGSLLLAIMLPLLTLTSKINV